MTIDWNHFTPSAALAGGLLIGLAAALLLSFNGRSAGISGIMGGLLARPRAEEFGWRAAFVLGLLLAPALYRLFADLPESRIDAGWATLVAAGLMVGYGSRLGSGCTSGHGVCGLGRGSPRSLAAVLTFMSVAILTVFITRHLLGGAP